MEIPQLNLLKDVPEEFERTLQDVNTLIKLYERKGLSGKVDSVSFVSQYFRYQHGQRYVDYDIQPDISTVEGRLLKNYPRVPIIRQVLVNHKEISKVEMFTPFSVSGPTQLQSINIAAVNSEYDVAAKVEGTRSVVEVTLAGRLSAVEKWDNGILDIVNGPDNISDKPYLSRRQVLIDAGLKLVPLVATVTQDVVLIRDPDPYVPGGTGGYARISPNKEINVDRVVDANQCRYHVRGSMIADSAYSVIKSFSVMEPPSKQVVRVNLETDVVVSEAAFLNDIVDVYTLEFNPAVKVRDVKIKHKEQQPCLCVPIHVLLKGNVHGVGLRKRLYKLYYGSRVKLKIQNTTHDVVIEGFVAQPDFLGFQMRTQAFGFAQKIMVEISSYTPEVIKLLSSITLI